MADIELRLRSAFTGGDLATLCLPGSCTLSELHQRAAHATGGRARVRLLLGGAVLEPGPGSLLDHGLAPAATLEVVFHTTPARFRQVGFARISDEGYHCHDSPLAPVSSGEPGKCYATWNRTPRGGGAQPEIAVADIAVDGGAAAGGGDDDGNDGDAELRMLRPVPQRRHHERYGNERRCFLEHCLLAVDSGACPLIGRHAVYHDVLRTDAILRQRADGSHEVLWRQEDDAEVRAAFNGTLRFQRAFFARGKVYALAKRTVVHENDRRTCSKVLLEGAIAGGDAAEGSAGVARRLTFERWCVQGEAMPAWSSVELVGVDAGGTGLWLEVRDHGDGERLVVVPLDSLEARCCWGMASQLPGRCNKVCLDPRTRDLYLLQDRAKEKTLERPEVPSVSVYRLRPAAGAESPESGLGRLSYDGSSPELICCEEFRIDEFSDMFCVTDLAWYVEASDALLFLDADDGLWSLPLADARHQEGVGQDAAERAAGARPKPLSADAARVAAAA